MTGRWLLAVLGCLLSGPILEAADAVKLPEPRRDGDVSLEECLAARRSVRSYQDGALSLAEVSQLLWAAQGITGPGGKRTAPSAGALYPLETYLVVGRVEGLSPGIYRYNADRGGLTLVVAGDKRKELAAAALGQQSVSNGAVTIVLSAVYSRTTGKYKDRGIRYVHIEIGHAGQNVCLQATALGLGTVTIGAFQDAEVKRIVGMSDEEVALYLLPVGRK